MHDPGLQVATVFYVDKTTFLKDVATRVPDVIVLSESSPLDRTRTSHLLQAILPQQALRVIVIRPEDNILEVYDKQCLKVTHNSDLISLIRHDGSDA